MFALNYVWRMKGLLSVCCWRDCEWETGRISKKEWINVNEDDGKGVDNGDCDVDKDDFYSDEDIMK